MSDYPVIPGTPAGVGLTQVAIAPTTGNINLSWGNHYLVDASGASGGPTLTLPAAQAGQSLRISMITDAPLNHSDEIIVRYQDTNEWHRLLLNEETAEFVSDAINVRCSHDGRKATKAWIFLSATETTGTAVSGAFTGPPLDAADADQNIGGLYDLANNCIKPRRKGEYLVLGSIFIEGAVDGTLLMLAMVRQELDTQIKRGFRLVSGGPNSVGFNMTAIVPITEAQVGGAAGQIDLRVYHDIGDTEKFIGNPAGVFTYLEATELL